MSDITSAGITRGTPGYGKMFLAALMSRSCWVRQDGHVQCLTQPNVRFSTACCSASGYARHRYAILTCTESHTFS